MSDSSLAPICYIPFLYKFVGKSVWGMVETGIALNGRISVRILLNYSILCSVVARDVFCLYEFREEAGDGGFKKTILRSPCFVLNFRETSQTRHSV